MGGVGSGQHGNHAGACRTTWTAEEDDKALGMRAAGKSRSQIAAALGRSASSVSNRLDHLRLEKLKQPDEAKATTNLRGNQSYWSPEHDQRALKMNAQGFSCGEIADALGRSKSSVTRRLQGLYGSTARPPAAPGQKGPKAKPEITWVKCLGGCGGTFQSPDRMRIRVCPKCKARPAWRNETGATHTLTL